MDQSLHMGTHAIYLLILFPMITLMFDARNVETKYIKLTKKSGTNCKLQPMAITFQAMDLIICTTLPFPKWRTVMRATAMF